jgi:transcriptional regulator with XRE-family HTH domain
VKFSSAKLKALVEADGRLGGEIARAAGFSPGSLSHWTLGKRVPGADELAALARVFNVPLEYFYDEAGPRRPPGRRREVLRPAPGRLVDLAVAEAEALAARAEALKAALRKLKPAPVSSKRTGAEAREEAVRIARAFASDLARRSK